MLCMEHLGLLANIFQSELLLWRYILDEIFSLTLHSNRYIHSNFSSKVRWAVAGRSESKLNYLLADLSRMKISNYAGITMPSVCIANNNDINSLKSLFSQAKLILNCTGPYRFLGETVVRTCIEVGSDYMDITGEPKFMEEMFLKYHDLAKNKGVLILHACAFDSVPADLGCLFAMSQYNLHCCNALESFLTIHCGSEGFGGHFTTYECAVYGISDKESLRNLRQEIAIKYQPSKLTFHGPSLKRYDNFFFDNRLHSYAFPFLGADASVVRATHRLLSLDSGDNIWPQYNAYFTLDSWKSIILFAIYGTIFQLLCTFEYGRSVLLHHPEFFTCGIFTHDGPSMQQLANTSFTMKIFSRGYSNISMIENTSSSSSSYSNNINTQLVSKKNQLYTKPDKEVVVTVSGQEPGYVATPAIFVTLALTVLEERSLLPSGGVYTPGAAFKNCTSIFDRLRKAGLHFDVSESNDK